jgi:hypothetical protein
LVDWKILHTFVGMIPIQIEGKTVFLTIDEWLNMTPEDYQNLVANNEGYEIDNPFDKILDKIKDHDNWMVKDKEPDIEDIKNVEDEPEA